MGFFDSKTKKTTINNDNKKSFVGGGSDFGGLNNRITITDGTSEAFEVVEDSLESLEAVSSDAFEFGADAIDSNERIVSDSFGFGDSSLDFAENANSEAFGFADSANSNSFDFADDANSHAFGFASKNSDNNLSLFESSIEAVTNLSSSKDDALSDTLGRFGEATLASQTGGMTETIKYLMMAAVGMVAFVSLSK